MKTDKENDRGGIQRSESDAKRNDLRAGGAFVEKTEAQQSKKGRDEGYKGFLHLECEYCGATHTFCAKHPMQVYKCSECGEITVLHDLMRMEQICECGNRSSYRTNTKEDMFDVACVCCGSPVAMAWHEGLRRYVPCDEELLPKKKKRRRSK